MLLNSKSILNCDEYEEKLHNEEIQLIVDKVCSLPNYDCAVIFKYMDLAHQKNDEIIKGCSFHDFMEMIEYTDFKNGIDIVIDDNNIFTLVAYGQGYYLNDEYYNVVTNIQILPYDENRKFLDVSRFFIQQELSIDKYN